MAIQLRAEQLDEIDAALRADRKIDAIRMYRLATGCELRDGIAFVEARSLQLASLPVAPAEIPVEVRRYLDSGFARPGELLGWWRTPNQEWCVLVQYQQKPEARFELGVFPAAVGHFGHQLNGYTCSLTELQQALAGPGLRGAPWSDSGSARQLQERLRDLQPAPADRPPANRPVVTQSRLPRALVSRSALFLLDGSRFEAEWLYLPKNLSSTWWSARRPVIEADGELQELRAELADTLFEGGEVQAAAGPLLWSMCHQQCALAGVLAESSDSLYADLEAQPPAWSSLAPEVMPAWQMLLSLVDLSAHRRSQLPWWLQGAAAMRSASVGLLGPSEARLMVRHAPALLALFSGPMLVDLRAQFTLIERAAIEQHWLLGWEAGN